jgi:hypothetical protein
MRSVGSIVSLDPSSAAKLSAGVMECSGVSKIRSVTIDGSFYSVDRGAIALAECSRYLPSSAHGQRSHAIDDTRSVLDGIGSGVLVGV